MKYLKTFEAIQLTDKHLPYSKDEILDMFLDLFDTTPVDILISDYNEGDDISDDNRKSSIEIGLSTGKFDKMRGDATSNYNKSIRDYDNRYDGLKLDQFSRTEISKNKNVYAKYSFGLETGIYDINKKNLTNYAKIINTLNNIKRMFDEVDITISDNHSVIWVVLYKKINDKNRRSILGDEYKSLSTKVSNDIAMSVKNYENAYMTKSRIFPVLDDGNGNYIFQYNIKNTGLKSVSDFVKSLSRIKLATHQILNKEQLGEIVDLNKTTYKGDVTPVNPYANWFLVFNIKNKSKLKSDFIYKNWRDDDDDDDNYEED